MTRDRAKGATKDWLLRLFGRQAVALAPLAAPLSNGGMEHVTGLSSNGIPTGEVLEAPPTPAEVEQALHWLHGTRHTRRKFERARYHITYKQRDEVAHVLVRLSRAYEERSDER